MMVFWRRGCMCEVVIMMVMMMMNKEKRNSNKKKSNDTRATLYKRLQGDYRLDPTHGPHPGACPRYCTSRVALTSDLTL